MHENLENQKGVKMSSTSPEVSVGTDLPKNIASKMAGLASFMVPSVLNTDWPRTVRGVFRRNVGPSGPALVALGTWQSYGSIKSLEEKGVPIGAVAENIVQNAPSKLGQVFNVLSEKLSAVDWRSAEDVTRAIESARETINPGEWGVIGDILFQGIDFSNLSVMDESTAYSLLAILGWHFLAKLGEIKIAMDIKKNEERPYENNFTRLFKASWHVLAPTLFSRRVLRSGASYPLAWGIRSFGYVELVASSLAGVAAYSHIQDPRIGILALVAPKAISLGMEAVDKIIVGSTNMYAFMYRLTSLLDIKSKEFLKNMSNVLGKNRFGRPNLNSDSSIHTRPTEKFDVPFRIGLGSEGKSHHGTNSGSARESGAACKSGDSAGISQASVGLQDQNKNMPIGMSDVAVGGSAKGGTEIANTKAMKAGLNIWQKLGSRFHTWLSGMVVLRGKVESAKSPEIGKSRQDPASFSKFTGEYPEYSEGNAQGFRFPCQNLVGGVEMVQVYNEYVTKYGELDEGRKRALYELIKAKGESFTPDDLRTFLYPFGDSYEIRHGRNDRGDLVTPPPSEDRVCGF